MLPLVSSKPEVSSSLGAVINLAVEMLELFFPFNLFAGASLGMFSMVWKGFRYPASRAVGGLYRGLSCSREMVLLMLGFILSVCLV